MKSYGSGKQKSTREIRVVLRNANMDFNSVVNNALNEYLPKIFHTCPFTDELCIIHKQCIECDSSKLTHIYENSKVK
jgi:hypothetical protein